MQMRWMFDVKLCLTVTYHKISFNNKDMVDQYSRLCIVVLCVIFNHAIGSALPVA
jgi:hypothetical protein